MKIGIYNYHEIYNNRNAIFNPEMYKIGENLEYPIVKLREKIIESGSTLDTLDMYPIEEYDKIIFLDLPNPKKINIEELYKMGKKLYLIILESQIIHFENMNTTNHKYFEKIFTWNDELVDNKKYIKLNISHKIPIIDTFDLEKKEKLCTLIAGNKKCKDKRELYSERVKAIEWFEKNQPEEFDLYGFGWDEYNFYGIKPIRALNRIKFLKKALAPNYITYHGKIKSKRETLEKYKFSICYENAKDISGYITEKIFDSFFAGCVPVYWGAPNITDFIPKECFIDRTQYKTYEELYKYLINMGDVEYKKYIKNIENFLKSEKIKQFSAEYFSEKVSSILVEKN